MKHIFGFDTFFAGRITGVLAAVLVWTVSSTLMEAVRPPYALQLFATLLVTIGLIQLGSGYSIKIGRDYVVWSRTAFWFFTTRRIRLGLDVVLVVLDDDAGGIEGVAFRSTTPGCLSEQVSPLFGPIFSRARADRLCSTVNGAIQKEKGAVASQSEA